MNSCFHIIMYMTHTNMDTTINLTIRFHHYNTHLYHIQVQCCCHNNFAISTKFATTINPCWNTLKFPTFVCFFQGKVHMVVQRQLASFNKGMGKKEDVLGVFKWENDPSNDSPHCWILEVTLLEILGLYVI